MLENIEDIYNYLKTGWNKPIGIHAHDNKNLALINSITAVKNGIDWCDATVRGMGRGAGNTATESLLLELSHNGYHDGNQKCYS